MTLRRARFEERACGDLWALANEYLPWFALRCHFTPDQVFDMPWPALVRLTFVADDQAAQADRARQAQWQAARQPRRMA